jgi:hypothetical protein
VVHVFLLSLTAALNPILVAASTVMPLLPNLDCDEVAARRFSHPDRAAALVRARARIQLEAVVSHAASDRLILTEKYRLTSTGFVAACRRASAFALCCGRSELTSREGPRRDAR